MKYLIFKVLNMNDIINLMEFIYEIFVVFLIFNTLKNVCNFMYMNIVGKYFLILIY